MSFISKAEANLLQAYMSIVCQARWGVCLALAVFIFFITPSASLASSTSDYSQSLYHERHTYIMTLFAAISRDNPDMVGSPAHLRSESMMRESYGYTQAGDFSAGLRVLEEVIAQLESLSSQPPLQEREESRYQSLLQGIPYFKQAYLCHVSEVQGELEGEFQEGYDESKVNQLLAQAEEYAQKGRYGEASIWVMSAQEQITIGIKHLLDHKAIGTVEYEIAPKQLPVRTEQEKAEDKYHHMQDSIDAFVAAHQRIQGEEVVGFDQDLVQWLLEEAKKLAGKQSFPAAMEILSHVRTLITKAIRDTLDGQDIVVKLDISTPELEYAYEYRRFLGYEELIPVAIERMRPNADTLKLIAYYAEEGKRMANTAQDKGMEGDYPIAISMILDATRRIQLALRTAGVPIYDSR